MTIATTKQIRRPASLESRIRPVTISGEWMVWLHTVFAYAAFASAFVFGCILHFRRIVKNEHYGYPDEWLPSVSATIGDWFPERSSFQILAAVAAGPRFAMIVLWCIVARSTGYRSAGLISAVGMLRTFCCGGWIFVTSSDSSRWHDRFMIGYLVLTVGWMMGCTSAAKYMDGPSAMLRRRVSTVFFTLVVPLVYFYVEHKVHRVGGAYSRYSICEWLLVVIDVAFDAICALEVSQLEIVVRPRRSTVGEKQTGWSTVTQVVDHPAFVYAADAVTGAVFWTGLTALGTCIWYFPLWHMGISGYEAVLAVTVLPAVLAIKPVGGLVASHPRTVAMVGLLPLIGFAIPNPDDRLFVVGAGVGFACLDWASSLHRARHDREMLTRKMAGFCAGLVLTSLAKYANDSNNPVWPIMNARNGGWNWTGLAVGTVGVWVSSGKSSRDGKHTETTRSLHSWGWAAAGVAGLLFGLHSLLSDSGTIIAWVWDGFPVRGPTAVPGGAMVLLAMSVGLVFGLQYPRAAGSWPAFAVGTAGAVVLAARNHWTGFYGGITAGMYLVAVAPRILQSAARFEPGRTFGVGLAGYNVLVLAHVWVVAYAFVPAGPILREHTDWVVAATFLLVGLGVYSTRQGEDGREGLELDEPEDDSRTSRKSVWFAVVLLAGTQLAAGLSTFGQLPARSIEAYHPDEKVITAGIWTIHFALDNDMWSSEHRMASLLAELEVDVVGLLESDLQRIITGNRDATRYLANQLQMHVDYGPGPNKHTWGAALLSKFPIMNSTHHLLPSPAGELAPAIHATVNAYDQLVDVIVFHSGQEEDDDDRRLQASYLASLLADIPSDRPVIFLSYLVTKPFGETYSILVSDRTGMRDIDPTDWDRWCEYILYKNIHRSGYARVSRDTITDTELQLGKFVVGRPDREVNLRKRVERDLSVGLRFPRMFRGVGVRGHRYHGIAPRYYE